MIFRENLFLFSCVSAHIASPYSFIWGNVYHFFWPCCFSVRKPVEINQGVKNWSERRGRALHCGAWSAAAVSMLQSPGLLVTSWNVRTPTCVPQKPGQPQNVRSSWLCRTCHEASAVSAFSRNMRALSCSFGSQFLLGAPHCLCTTIGVRRQRGRAKEPTADL